MLGGATSSSLPTTRGGSSGVGARGPSGSGGFGGSSRIGIGGSSGGGNIRGNQGSRSDGQGPQPPL
ncbi:hypothetical protein KI387_043917 [Taxus chinensis]|uniref:Uncharacterized protein n=1 Tax=Taxus chinensis TaxID=29808 RepID=A0AA38LHN3_TAXCH|nr:hypothetical protein KI387_043917 [Taxus chinensis]